MRDGTEPGRVAGATASRRSAAARGEKSDLAGRVLSLRGGAAGLKSRSFPRTKSAIDSCCAAGELGGAAGDPTAGVRSSFDGRPVAGSSAVVPVAPRSGALRDNGDFRPGRVARRSPGFLGPRLVPALEWLDDWPDELDAPVPDVPGSAQATGCALAPAIPIPMATTDKP
ncbi:hypothetical protein ACNQP7_25480 [Mycolicibacterium fortuitum]|uniref:hypothetical protein n=1 Tax=Mycolicibacterium fortuitum TaxID=1766 RepID=UPI003AAD5C44